MWRACKGPWCNFITSLKKVCTAEVAKLSNLRLLFSNLPGLGSVLSFHTCVLLVNRTTELFDIYQYDLGFHVDRSDVSVLPVFFCLWIGLDWTNWYRIWTPCNLRVVCYEDNNVIKIIWCKWLRSLHVFAMVFISVVLVLKQVDMESILRRCNCKCLCRCKFEPVKVPIKFINICSRCSLTMIAEGVFLISVHQIWIKTCSSPLFPPTPYSRVLPRLIWCIFGPTDPRASFCVEVSSSCLHPSYSTIFCRTMIDFWSSFVVILSEFDLCRRFVSHQCTSRKSCTDLLALRDFAPKHDFVTAVDLEFSVLITFENNSAYIIERSSECQFF